MNTQISLKTEKISSQSTETVCKAVITVLELYLGQLKRISYFSTDHQQSDSEVCSTEQKATHTAVQGIRGDLIALHSYRKGGCSEVGVGLPSNKLQDKRKWPQVIPGKFRSGIRKNFFTENVIEHWNRLPREVVEYIPGGI